jgi:hypothetical protein
VVAANSRDTPSVAGDEKLSRLEAMPSEGDRRVVVQAVPFKSHRTSPVRAIGMRARPKRFIYADDLPKTRSAKTCGCCATSPRAASAAT